MSPSQKAVWKKPVMWLRCGNAPLPGVWRHCFKMHGCRSAVYKELRHFEACCYYRLDNFKMFLSWKSSLLGKRKIRGVIFTIQCFWFQPAWQSIQLCVCACYAWSSTCILTNTQCAFAELSEAHLLCSCSTEPTLQALSLCVFLGNSHSLFTFAFLHCDSHQNNIAPAPLETDCQAFLFKVAWSKD